MYEEYLPGLKHGGEEPVTSDFIEDFEDCGYVLSENDLVVDIDSLSKDQIQKMIERFRIKTQIVWTQRGCHLYFKRPDGFRRAKGVNALGFECEYKHKKNTRSITVKQNGIARQTENTGIRENLPDYLKPNAKFNSLLGFSEGDGRNDALFKHRAKLASFKNWQQMVKFINDAIFDIPLPDKEIETLTRDMVVEAVKDGEALIANVIMREKRVVRFSQQLYFYENDEYTDDEDALRRMVYKYCEGQKTRYVDEVIRQMEYRAKLIPQNQDFDIKFKNGILRDGQFIEVDYTDFTPYSIDIELDTEAEPVEVVNRYLDHLTDGDKAYRDRLMETLGHSLIVNKEFKRLMGKFFIFVGDGGNGKGTLLAVIRAILNSKNCAGLSITNMSDEKYLNVLQGKLVNLGDDIQDEPINHNQMKMLKNISTCDFVEIRKLYKNANSIELTPTLIFTSNHILKSFEKGESYKRRVDWLPMYGKLKKKEKDFISNLTSEKALKYWVRLITEGYFRLYKNQKFTRSEKVEAFNQAYHEENNSTLLFIGDLTQDDVINKRSPEIYQEYETWAEENGLTVQSSRLFKDTLCELLEVKIKPRKINGKTAKVFVDKGE